jgi:riboflavin kinase/FMN adenylyltransferase
MDTHRHYINWDEPIDPAYQHGAVTIGNFDGVHRGHQALLAELVRQAQTVGGPVVVLTFDPHPLQLLRPEHFPPLLTTVPQRAELLSQHGADCVLILRTTHDMLQLSARAFFERVLRDHLRPRMIVPGFNFAFGHNREGTAEKLAEFCQEAGINCVQVPPTRIGGEIISSSRIRAALSAGDVRQGAELLGRRYALTGLVGTGQRRGQKLGFPTANLYEVRTLLPADGVYAVRARLGEQTWPAAANIGPNPTFGEEARKLEVHLIDFDGDLYGRTLTVEFVDRLRGTRRFASVPDLVEQLKRDVAQARAATAPC